MHAPIDYLAGDAVTAMAWATILLTLGLVAMVLIVVIMALSAAGAL